MQTEIVPPFTEERIAAENREVRAYVRCMRAWVERSRSLALGGPVPCGAADTRRLRRARGDPEGADQYYRDTADCGIPAYRQEWSDDPLP